MVDRKRLGGRLLRARYWLYALVLLLILALRFVPGLRTKLPVLPSPPTKGQDELRIAGLDTAPDLIPKLVAFYQSLYPRLRVDVRAGGTIRAVEDLLNRRSDVAFISRPLSAPEDSVVRAVGDSLLTFPIAVAGILVVTSERTGLDSLSVGDLRFLISGGRLPNLTNAAGGPSRIYFPDPETGLWGAVSDQLDLGNVAGPNVAWAGGDGEVVRSVARDPGSIGLASGLVLDATAAEPGCRVVSISSGPGHAASKPLPDNVAGGWYPLYHRLYAACRVRTSPAASAFITYMHGDQGQRLVRHEGYLPAREIAREILLGGQPIGMAG